MMSWYTFRCFWYAILKYMHNQQNHIIVLYICGAHALCSCFAHMQLKRISNLKILKIQKYIYKISIIFEHQYILKYWSYGILSVCKRLSSNLYIFPLFFKFVGPEIWKSEMSKYLKNHEHLWKSENSWTKIETKYENVDFCWKTKYLIFFSTFLKNLEHFESLKNLEMFFFFLRIESFFFHRETYFFVEIMRRNYLGALIHI